MELCLVTMQNRQKCIMYLCTVFDLSRTVKTAIQHSFVSSYNRRLFHCHLRVLPMQTKQICHRDHHQTALVRFSCLLINGCIPLLFTLTLTQISAEEFTEFQQTDSPAITKALGVTPKHYRQLEPSLYYLSQRYADSLSGLSSTQRHARLVALAQFIDVKRNAVADAPVIGPGCNLIGLLDPDHGLDPKEITSLATAYDCTSTIYKKTNPSETLEDVGNKFLQSVTAAVESKNIPTTIIVLGHGLPTEIQSYHIPVDRLAKTLLTAATHTNDSSRVDLSHLTIICDDCYSADFMINLATRITDSCRTQSLHLKQLPTLIAGTNRNCVGHADVGQKFVPHFWRNVIELFYIRRPRPTKITLGDFFEKVDNMMFGYGRRPIIQGSRVVGYRLINPEMVQDPVVFVPLSDTDLDALRKALGLQEEVACDRFLDIG